MPYVQVSGINAFPIYNRVCTSHTLKMSERVHICSVERQLEPQLEEKLVTLCSRLENTMRKESNMNESVRCMVGGVYLATAMLNIDGYYHVNDQVVREMLEECELAFGSNTTTVQTDPSQKSMTLECKFMHRPGNSFVKFVILIMLLFSSVLFWYGIYQAMPDDYDITTWLPHKLKNVSRDL